MKRNLFILLFIALMIILSLIPTQDVVQIDLNHIFEHPSLNHLLGTDNLGKDVFALLIQGCLRTCTVIVIATAIAFIIGNILGVIAGYFGRFFSHIIQLFTEITLVIPSFIIALIISALFGINPISAGIVFGIGNMGEYINQSKALTEHVKKSAFIDAEIVLGLNHFQLIAYHIIPNILRPLLTFMGNKASNVSIQYAALTFIGLGTDISHPDWGTMLYQYRLYILYQPTLIIWPTLAIFSLACFFHYIFDDMDTQRQSGVSLYD